MQEIYFVRYRVVFTGANMPLQVHRPGEFNQIGIELSKVGQRLNKNIRLWGVSLVAVHSNERTE